LILVIPDGGVNQRFEPAPGRVEGALEIGQLSMRTCRDWGGNRRTPAAMLAAAARGKIAATA
jgi:hypothetical protein